MGHTSAAQDALQELEKTELIDQVVLMDKALRASQLLAVAGQFSAAIMHEINNPLAAVSNLNYLVQQQSEDPHQVRALSRVMEEQLHRVAEICRRTLSFYRTADTMEAIAVASLADAALRVHHAKIEAKHIQLQLDIPAGVMVHVHAGEMLEVFSNLIANAVDVLPERGSLHLRATQHAESVHVLIADNGPGIPSEIVGKIFLPFFTTKKERGNGLGLAISREIVERHRGAIRLKTSTRIGRSGTAFCVCLPLDLDQGKSPAV